MSERLTPIWVFRCSCGFAAVDREDGQGEVDSPCPTCGHKLGPSLVHVVKADR